MIEVKNLSLKTRDKVILDNINFNIKKNEIVGLFGHNAAGKSTLQRLIANEDVIFEGDVYIEGKRNIYGAVSDCVLITEKLLLKNNASIKSNLNHINSCEQLDINYVYDKLSEFKIDVNVMYGSLSRGSKQIVNIIFCLAKKASLYLFDEPLSSIDVFNRKLIADLILDIQEKGGTVIVTTHMINEFQMLFDRVIYLNEGKIEYDITVENIFKEGYKNIEDFVIDKFGGDHDE
ncbi:MAG: ATP-binding cassette domain-containing protein [Bacilli bacterium]